MDYQALVKDCLKGKPAAQRQLYDHFAGPMLSVCYRYTKSMADAEDVLQEGFVKVFFNLHQFKFQGELGGWIRRIMVTTAINFLKRNLRYSTELMFTDDHLHVDVGYTRVTPHDADDEQDAPRREAEGTEREG